MQAKGVLVMCELPAFEFHDIPENVTRCRNVESCVVAPSLAAGMQPLSESGEEINTREKKAE